MCGRAPCEIMLCTWSEEFRRLTEARTVARWAKTEREEFYLLVKQKRGDAAMRQLVEDIRAVWGSV